MIRYCIFGRLKKPQFILLVRDQVYKETKIKNKIVIKIILNNVL